MKKIMALCFFFLVAELLGGCFEQKNKYKGGVESSLNILAGSELRDMKPILDEIGKKTDIKLNLTYEGTIAGAEKLWAGEKFDAAWFSQSKHLMNDSDFSKKVKLSEKMMLSPVVIGIREDFVSKNQIKAEDFNWGSFANLVEGGMKFGMADPATSNTGYAALMGIAYYYGGQGESLREHDIKEDNLRKLFKNHALNSGASGWLADAYLNKYQEIEAIINYENILINLNKKLPENSKLKIFYPKEGIATADYPLLLLNDQKRDLYIKFTSELKRPEIQEKIANITSRRSINHLVNEKFTWAGGMLIEMPFSVDNNVQEKLFAAYYGKIKKPASFVFVVDISGSMKEENREKKMKEAFASLTVKKDDKMKWAKIRDREHVWVIPFSGRVGQGWGVRLGENSEGNKIALEKLNDFVQKLPMGGGTALFSATMEAVKTLSQENSMERQLSIILLTDGESNQGMTYRDFLQSFNQERKGRDIKIFPIIFGNANEKESHAISEISGGKVFDGRDNLNKTFKEIRSYQ